MNQLSKNLAASLLRRLVFMVPWGARQVILRACIDRIGAVDVGALLFRELNIIECAAAGDREIITASSGDKTVLTEYARTGTLAETVTMALVSFFGDGGGTYIDIGANIGLTTIPIARNPLVRCLAFEPEPANFEFLRRNVTRNASMGQVDFEQVALFDSSGEMSLALQDENIGDYRLTRAGIPGRRTVTVTTRRLDDYADRVTEPLAVKIDTQGAEPFVVSGGQGVLARAGLLVMEFCPFLMRQLGGDATVVIDLLDGFDRVAVVTGGVAETPVFISVPEARSLLHGALPAGTSDGDYLDIMAVR